MNRRAAIAAGAVVLIAGALAAVLLLRRGPPLLLRYRWRPATRLRRAAPNSPNSTRLTIARYEAAGVERPRGEARVP